MVEIKMVWIEWNKYYVQTPHTSGNGVMTGNGMLSLLKSDAFYDIARNEWIVYIHFHFHSASDQCILINTPKCILFSGSQI